LRPYHSVLILKPDLDEGHVDQAVEKISGFIDRFGGKVHKLEKWGKKRLAYRVRKNKFGYYLNIYHGCDPLRIAELEKEFQLFDQIIKYLIIRLEEKDLERVMTRAAEAAAAVLEGEEGEGVVARPSAATAVDEE